MCKSQQLLFPYVQEAQRTELQEKTREVETLMREMQVSHEPIIVVAVYVLVMKYSRG